MAHAPSGTPQARACKCLQSTLSLSLHSTEPALPGVVRLRRPVAQAPSGTPQARACKYCLQSTLSLSLHSTEPALPGVVRLAHSRGPQSRTLLQARLSAAFQELGFCRTRQRPTAHSVSSMLCHAVQQCTPDTASLSAQTSGVCLLAGGITCSLWPYLGLSCRRAQTARSELPPQAEDDGHGDTNGVHEPLLRQQSS